MNRFSNTSENELRVERIRKNDISDPENVKLFYETYYYILDIFDVC